MTVQEKDNAYHDFLTKLDSLLDQAQLLDVPSFEWDETRSSNNLSVRSLSKRQMSSRCLCPTSSRRKLMDISEQANLQQQDAGAASVQGWYLNNAIDKLNKIIREQISKNVQLSKIIKM